MRDLPAPQVGPLQAGDAQVLFTQYASGVTLTVYLNGSQVGKGGGPVVPISNVIAFGDVVIVAQDLPGCTGRRALKIAVPCGDPPIGGDPAGPDLFPIGVIDVARGSNAGGLLPRGRRWNGPALQHAPGRLGRAPLVVMAHGNHDAGVPNDLGYEFFQADLGEARDRLNLR